ncbi:MAG: hypothetical protein NC898_05720 [Candidatus Omnitrophica bacterium]|nr:hypothetical protein [Candidatus Omnitrophota bacterium]MCM8793940.1 hypothetical protein [Candidatus Omnitrophota bacterium]
MPDYLEIFRGLNQKKIKYIVVGGLAVNFLGVPRMTYDIDLLLYLEESNLRKFLRLMKEWGFKPKLPVEIMDFADREKRRNWIKQKNMKAFNLVNPDWEISEIDIVLNTPVDYSQAKKNLSYFHLGGVSIPVISIRDLIKMKQVSNRLQDKKDIENLKKILYEKK